jgi:hypothetical protein
MSSLAFVISCGCAGLVTLLPNTINAALASEWETRAAQSLATPEGRAYEEQANKAFWGSASFMGECAPITSKLPDPVTLYVEILSDGRMGQFEIIPMTDVAKCIKERRGSVQFPKPPVPYVLKLQLRFTP